MHFFIGDGFSRVPIGFKIPFLCLNPTPSNSNAALSVICRDSKEHEFLFSNQPALSSYSMSPMEGVVITARDGLQLPAYLSLPVLPEGQVRFRL